MSFSCLGELSQNYLLHLLSNIFDKQYFSDIFFLKKKQFPSFVDADNIVSSKCTHYTQPHRLYKYSIKTRHGNAPFTKLMYSDTSNTNNIAVPILPAWLQRLSDSHIATALAILWQCYPALQQTWLLCLMPAQILWMLRCRKSSRRLTYCGRGRQVHAGNLWAAVALMQPNNALGIMD